MWYVNLSGEESRPPVSELFMAHQGVFKGPVFLDQIFVFSFLFFFFNCLLRFSHSLSVLSAIQREAGFDAAPANPSLVANFSFFGETLGKCSGSVFPRPVKECVCVSVLVCSLLYLKSIQRI